MSIQTGNVNDNHLIGDDDPDSLYGLGGNDVLEGKGGDDLLDGGEGDDRMEGGLGDDTYYVDSAEDMVVEYEGEGTDTVFSAIDIDLAAGGFENIENFVLTGSATRLVGISNGMGNALANYIEAAALGAATLYGMEGDDEIHGGKNSDTIDGGDGMDTIHGYSGFDVIAGGADNDMIFGGGNADTIHGDDGHDNLNGQAGHDEIYGDAGNDLVKGGFGNDLVDGGEGDDNLFGNAGQDLLIGGAGRDTMTGGTGADTFKFLSGDNAGFDGDTADRITDFSRGDGDKLDISGLVTELYNHGGQSFTFIGDAEFTGQTPDANGRIMMGQGVGEVRYEFVDDHTMVEVDFNGDAQADFAFRVDGTLNLVESDFQFWYFG